MDDEIDGCAGGVLAVERDDELVAGGLVGQFAAAYGDAFDIQGGTVQGHFPQVSRKGRHAQSGGADDLARGQVEG